MGKTSRKIATFARTRRCPTSTVVGANASANVYARNVAMAANAKGPAIFPSSATSMTTSGTRSSIGPMTIAVCTPTGCARMPLATPDRAAVCFASKPSVSSAASAVASSGHAEHERHEAAAPLEAD